MDCIAKLEEIRYIAKQAMWDKQGVQDDKYEEKRFSEFRHENSKNKITFKSGKHVD